MINEKEHRICCFCKFFIRRTQEEYCNSSYNEIKRFHGYCRRYPKKEEVMGNYQCGEWEDKKKNCRFKNSDGECMNSYFIKGCLCKNLICDLDVL